MNIAILGFGTVGSGVWKVIHDNQERLAQYVGAPVVVKKILDLRDPVDPDAKAITVRDIREVLEDPDIQVVVECMGGVEPARSFVSQALESGKSVATSNKELVAAHGASLMQLAAEHQVDFLYEASVGGGIPVIRTLQHALAQEQIDTIEGILNGTTNYILTRMEDEGLSYETILKDAQDLGYAERNPDADVLGFDACRKIAILASLMTGKTVRFEDIPTTGITGITPDDMEKAKAEGKKIRLIAHVDQQEGSLRAWVRPEKISEDHPLASVWGVNNAIRIHGNMVGDVKLEGQGAGSEATASAVVADVLEALQNRKNGLCGAPGWTQEVLPVNTQENI